MHADVEETLVRELRQVADGLHVPALPPLPTAAPSRHGRWRQPLLVAAAVVLVTAGAVTALTIGGGERPEPAPPPATQTPSVTPSGDTAIPRSAPTLPYVLDGRLVVAGEQVPGTWWTVEGRREGWLGWSRDYTFWWGRGAEPHRLAAGPDVAPAISPSGRYVVQVAADNGTTVLTALDTATGEDLGSVPVDLGDPQDGSAVTIRAVTDDGEVIAQGRDTALLWQPLAGGDTVDLTETAPGQVVLAATPAGLVVTEGTGDVTAANEAEPYLAELTADGRLTRSATLPPHDFLVVSPGGIRSAWLPPGTLGGEVTEVAAIEAQAVAGDRRVTLSAPDGWGFAVQSWAWEDDTHLVARVVRDGNERLARCDAVRARCVLVGS